MQAEIVTKVQKDDIHEVESLSFSLLGSEQLIRLAAVEVTSEFAMKSGEVQNQGTIDKRMGTYKNDEICATCRDGPKNCPGHFGRFRLVSPVINVLFCNYVFEILKCVCYNCSRVLINKNTEKYTSIMNIADGQSRFEALKKTMAKRIQRYGFLKCAFVNRETGNADGCCLMEQPKYKKKQNSIEMEFRDKQPKPCRESEIKKIIESIDQCDYRILALEDNDPSGFFIKDLVIPANTLRTANKNSSHNKEHERTMQLHEIIKTSKNLERNFKQENNNKNSKNQTNIHSRSFLKKESLKKEQSNQKIEEKEKQKRKKKEKSLLDDLATFNQQIAGYIDSDSTSERITVGTNPQKIPKNVKGIMQGIISKYGIIRSNLMAKRVNFCARTPISGDDDLSINQVGVPIKFARKLTPHIFVSGLNINEMTKLVCLDDGDPNKPIGIIKEQEKFFEITNANIAKHLPLKIGWKIVRLFKDNDIVIFNRQPSLHAPSIQAFYGVLMPYGSTFRMNNACCPPFNADFDGDEMSLYLCIVVNAASEARLLMLAENNMISAQSGRPIMALVQNGLTGCRLLSSKDVFFTKKEMSKLLMNTSQFLKKNSKPIPPPSIFKPEPLWTGKQLLTYILPDDFNYKMNASMSDFTPADKKYANLKSGDVTILSSGEEVINPWFNARDLVVEILNGEVISGTFCKNTIGCQSGSIIQYMFHNYGPERNRDFLEDAQKIVGAFLNMRGFSVGMKDFEPQRTDKLINSSSKLLQMEETLKKVQPEMTHRGFEELSAHCMGIVRGDICSGTMESLLRKNSVKSIVEAKTKGTTGFVNQMLAAYGQITIGEERIQNGLDGHRVLSCFETEERSITSAGFCSSNFLHGLEPHEEWFSSQAGRVSVVDSLIKTARVGYMQRRTTKASESAVVKNDRTVRNTNNQIIQFCYGDDNFDGKSMENQTIFWKDMNRENLNSNYFWSDNELKEFYTNEFEFNECKNIVYCEKIRLEKDIQENNFWLKKTERIAVNFDFLLKKHSKNRNKIYKSDLKPHDVIIDVYNLQKSLFDICPNLKLRWEIKFCIILRSFLNSKRIIKEYKISKEEWKKFLKNFIFIYVNSLIPAGFAVGISGSQSISEIITQLTLGQYHHSGNSGKNVTLGIPRIEEIINVPKTIKTPAMTIFLKSPFNNDKKFAKALKNYLQYSPLKNYIVNKYCKERKDVPTFIETFETEVNFDEDIDSIDFSEVAKTFFPSQLPNKKFTYSANTLVIFEIDMIKLSKDGYSLSKIIQLIREKYKTRFIIDVSNEHKKIALLEMRPSEEYGPKEKWVDEILQWIPNNIIISGFSSLERCYTRFETTGKNEWLVETTGSDLKNVIIHPLVNQQRCYTNNITELKDTFGIEVSRKAIITEIELVLSRFGCFIDQRHLMLLSEIMCLNGNMMPITRFGINKLKSLGVFVRASFEQTKEVIKSAARYGLKEDCKGASAAIMAGKIPEIGTGFVNLLHDLNPKFKKLEHPQPTEFTEEVQLLIQNKLAESNLVESEIANKKLIASNKRKTQIVEFHPTEMDDDIDEMDDL